jgi:hypothetical protein
MLPMSRQGSAQYGCKPLIEEAAFPDVFAETLLQLESKSFSSVEATFRVFVYPESSEENFPDSARK